MLTHNTVSKLRYYRAATQVFHVTDSWICSNARMSICHRISGNNFTVSKRYLSVLL